LAPADDPACEAEPGGPHLAGRANGNKLVCAALRSGNRLGRNPHARCLLNNPRPTDAPLGSDVGRRFAVCALHVDRRSLIMRSFLVALALSVIGLVVDVAPSGAEITYPWCAQYRRGGG